MPVEHPDYRNNIEQLNRMFPKKEMLTIADIMKVYGYKSPSSVHLHFKLTRGKLSKASLARHMCERS